MQDRDANHVRQCRIVMPITVKLNRWPILATRIDASQWENGNAQNV